MDVHNNIQSSGQCTLCILNRVTIYLIEWFVTYVITIISSAAKVIIYEIYTIMIG